MCDHHNWTATFNLFHNVQLTKLSCLHNCFVKTKSIFSELTNISTSTLFQWQSRELRPQPSRHYMSKLKVKSFSCVRWTCPYVWRKCTWCDLWSLRCDNIGPTDAIDSLSWPHDISDLGQISERALWMTRLSGLMSLNVKETFRLKMIYAYHKTTTRRNKQKFKTKTNDTLNKSMRVEGIRYWSSRRVCGKENISVDDTENKKKVVERAATTTRSRKAVTFQQNAHKWIKM